MNDKTLGAAACLRFHVIRVTSASRLSVTAASGDSTRRLRTHHNSFIAAYLCHRHSFYIVYLTKKLFVLPAGALASDLAVSLEDAAENTPPDPVDDPGAADATALPRLPAATAAAAVGWCKNAAAAAAAGLKYMRLAELSGSPTIAAAAAAAAAKF